MDPVHRHQGFGSIHHDQNLKVYRLNSESKLRCLQHLSLPGHTGAILQLQFTKDGKNVVTCSTDKTMALWDLEAGTRVRRCLHPRGGVGDFRGLSPVVSNRT